MSGDHHQVSARVVALVRGFLIALLTRGAPAAPSARQLALAAAQALDLGVRTVQRAFKHPDVAELAGTLVCPTGTTRVPAAEKPQVDGLPQHPDDETDTSLLLGPLCPSSPAPTPGQGDTEQRKPGYYTRLRPNDHPGYCVNSWCRRWIEIDEGAILVPYPQNEQVRLLCAVHALEAEIEITLAGVKA